MPTRSAAQTRQMCCASAWRLARPWNGAGHPTASPGVRPPQRSQLATTRLARQTLPGPWSAVAGFAGCRGQRHRSGRPVLVNRPVWRQRTPSVQQQPQGASPRPPIQDHPERRLPPALRRLGRVGPGITLRRGPSDRARNDSGVAPGCPTPQISVWCGPEAWPEPDLSGPQVPGMYRTFDSTIDELVGSSSTPLAAAVSGGLDSNVHGRLAGAPLLQVQPAAGVLPSPIPTPSWGRSPPSTRTTTPWPSSWRAPTPAGSRSCES